jgi:hypothetical protein
MNRMALYKTEEGWRCRFTGPFAQELTTRGYTVADFATVFGANAPAQTVREVMALRFPECTVTTATDIG